MRSRRRRKKKKKKKSRLEGPCWTLCVFGEQIHKEVPRWTSIFHMLEGEMTVTLVTCPVCCISP
jgi:hypothetical protein